MPLLTIIMNHMQNLTTTSLDSEKLRSAMRAWSAGVTVVTAVYEGIKHGMTVNSFTSISLDPAMITISMRGSTFTHDLVFKSRAFGLTILSAKQSHISDIFAGKIPEAIDRFANLQTEALVTGSPLIAGGLAWLDCSVVETFTAGENTLFIAKVLAARDMNHELPLIYHDRKYWNLSSLE